MARHRVSVSSGRERQHSRRRHATATNTAPNSPEGAKLFAGTNIVVIQTEKTLFRVNAARLLKYSLYFRDVFRSMPTLLGKGAYPSIGLVVEESAEAMSVFLGLMFKSNYTPQSMDDVVIAIHLSLRFRVQNDSPLNKRLERFLYDTYPTTWYHLDRLQTGDPLFQSNVWLQSEACFRLANALYLLRKLHGGSLVLDNLLFIVLLCCARRPLYDIHHGVVSPNRRHWYKLESEIHSLVLFSMRPKINELARDGTYGFLWSEGFAPSNNEAHEKCRFCCYPPDLGPPMLCDTHKGCGLYRNFLRDEVSILKDANSGYSNPFWHFPNLEAAKPIHGVICCQACRDAWISSIHENRAYAWDVLMEMYMNMWK